MNISDCKDLFIDFAKGCFDATSAEPLAPSLFEKTGKIFFNNLPTVLGVLILGGLAGSKAYSHYKNSNSILPPESILPPGQGATEERSIPSLEIVEKRINPTSWSVNKFFEAFFDLFQSLFQEVFKAITSCSKI